MSVQKTILLIDDSPTSRGVARQVLLDSGYRVLEAPDGEVGLETLRKEQVQLVVSDLVMPRLDGFGLVHGMRAIENHKFTPVLMLTSISRDDLREQGLSMGIRAWVTKPVLPDHLLDTVKKLLGP
ncbi:MAG: response regulator [Fibrobacteria bacterium]|nr:response regulator [Fibrobacteria bacterium]